MIEHKTISLAEQVFEHLEQDILSGKYQRGEVLTELSLCSELGVSRTPVREALRRLAQEHIIEETSKGSRVIGISEDDLRDIFDIREKIEGTAALLAARNCTDEQIAKLKDALDLQEFYCVKSDAEQIKQMDNRFHELIYRFCGSLTYYDALMPLHKKVQKYRRTAVENKNRAKSSVEEHKAIYEAIAKRDEQGAFDAMTFHIQNAYKHIFGKD